MEVVILGSGTATPQLKRNASGILVRSSSSTILVDIGTGTMRRLCEAGVDYKEIDVVLITHFHPDHVSDLAPFLFAHNYAYGKMRTNRFFVLGPSGLEQLYDGLVKLYGSWIVPTGGRLEIRELSADETDGFLMDTLNILSTPAEHSRPCISLRIDDHGKSVVISGDTNFSENLVRLAHGTDLFICECSMPDDKPIEGHCTPSVAARMASMAAVKKLALTHFYPPCDQIDVVAQASVFYSGPIVKSEDLLKIKI